MYNLFLDDFRQPKDAFKLWGVNIYSPDSDVRWIAVKNAQEFYETINRLGVPQIVSFDHDLADEHYDQRTWNSEERTPPDGFDCAKMLLRTIQESDTLIPEIHIHSQNPVGSKRIFSYFYSFFKHLVSLEKAQKFENRIRKERPDIF